MTLAAPIIVATDRTGTPLAELEDAAVSQLGWTLNDADNQTQVTIPPLSKYGQYIELMKSEFQVWVNGNLVWWGFPESMSATPQLITYTCSDLLGYMKYRFITNTSLTYTNVDQLSILSGIVSQMQAGTFQSFNIGSAAVSPSGHLRNRQYNWYEHKMALDLLKEFPTLNDGADFAIDIDNTGSLRAFHPYYPSKGSYKPNYALEWGKNILTFNNWTEDGTKLATLDYCKGGSSNGVYFENHYEDTAASQYWGQFQAITSDSGEQDTDWLLSEAIQEVSNRNKPQLIPITVAVSSLAGKSGLTGSSSGSQDMLANLKVGDSVPLFVNLGRLQANGEQYRIVKALWKADNTYTLTLNKVPVPFVYPPPGPIL